MNPVGVSSGSLLNPQRPSTERFCCHVVLVDWINSRLAAWKINHLFNIAGNGKPINQSYLDLIFDAQLYSLLLPHHKKVIRSLLQMENPVEQPVSGQAKDHDSLEIQLRISPNKEQFSSLSL